MFDQLSQKLDGVFKKLRGHGTLTEENIRESMREVRRALLEADVNFQVAKDFVKKVEERAVGTETLRTLHPGEHVIKIVHEVLVETLGGTSSELAESKQKPTRILIVGLQGSGKTTFTAKLGHHLRKQRRKTSLLAACDVYRPAAMDQLASLGKQIDLPVHLEQGETDAVGIARRALDEAKAQGRDYLLVDTAGRLHIDDAMMDELVRMKGEIQPHQVVLVVDGMTGQDAISVAEAFHAKLGIDGLVLSKMDGDARGGAALSIRAVTGIPIFFLGTGEAPKALDVFYPDRLAQRILGMGDIVSLAERAQAEVSEEEAAELEDRMRKETFSFEDFLGQLKKIRRMGPLGDLMKMIPGISNQLPANFQIDEKQISKVQAIIQSMTVEERHRPDVIDTSRRRRIAKGSGTSNADVKKLINDFLQMRKMMGQLTRMGPKELMKMAKR